MYILPYFKSTCASPFSTKKTQPVTIYHLLLVGGTSLWEEDNPDLRIQEDILEPNGLFLAPLTQPQLHRIGEMSVYYCPIDPARTSIADFYQWSEICPGDTTFCWRPIYGFHEHGMMHLPAADDTPLPWKEVLQWMI